MKLNDSIVVIPALKKKVAFQDDLVKKLAGITLIKRTIQLGKQLVGQGGDIYVLTDSEEIGLIARRNGVASHLDAGLDWGDDSLTEAAISIASRRMADRKYLVVLSPYAPMLKAKMVESAYVRLESESGDILRPFKMENQSTNGELKGIEILNMFRSVGRSQKVASDAFSIIRLKALIDELAEPHRLVPYEIEHDLVEIASYQDWWVCEKLLQRRRIVFRVIGDDKVGMGHIYRALTLAHEITDHEVMFVSDSENRIAVNNLAGYEYWLGIYEKDEIEQRIIDLAPDLVVNDILNTNESYIRRLRDAGIKVVNFEDLGSGAGLADLTFNELYDEPEDRLPNSYWGREYYFIRDEFVDARVHEFSERVDRVLLTFGGTDQLDLTRRTYRSIVDYCQQAGIQINIVTGPGYAYFDELSKEVADSTHVVLTRATGVISSYMEKAQIAICSNGRTVYELAHMNIPSIVISQHDRESTHGFSHADNGFMSLGVYRDSESDQQLRSEFERLVTDHEYRRTLFQRMNRFDFYRNKEKVLGMIQGLLGA